MKNIFILLPLVFFTIIISGCSSSGTSTSSKSSSSCSCSGNVYNCDDFSSHKKAQACYESCGGVDNDIHRLDRDGDGSACETLP